jgi:hypothetical protein
MFKHNTAIFVLGICHFCLRPLNYLLQAVFLTLMFEMLLTLILLRWNVGWAPNNASKWQMGFNSAFKGVNLRSTRSSGLLDIPSNVIKFVVGFNTTCSIFFGHRLPWGFHNMYCSNCRLLGSNTLHVCRQTLVLEELAASIVKSWNDWVHSDIEIFNHTVFCLD